MSTFTETDMEQLEKKIKSGSTPMEKIPMLLKRGQVSFHHAKTIHGSLTNNSDNLRIALAVHLQPGHNRHKPTTDAKGKPVLHINDVLCRRDDGGDPDYSDPDICPLLWSEG